MPCPQSAARTATRASENHPLPGQLTCSDPVIRHSSGAHRRVWRSARRAFEASRIASRSSIEAACQRRISDNARPQPMQTSASSRQQSRTQGDVTVDTFDSGGNFTSRSYLLCTELTCSDPVIASSRIDGASYRRNIRFLIISIPKPMANTGNPHRCNMLSLMQWNLVDDSFT